MKTIIQELKKKYPELYHNLKMRILGNGSSPKWKYQNGEKK